MLTLVALAVATALESALSLGGIGANTLAPAVANPAVAVPPVSLPTPTPINEPQINTNGLALHSALSLGNLLALTVSPA